MFDGKYGKFVENIEETTLIQGNEENLFCCCLFIFFLTNFYAYVVNGAMLDFLENHQVYYKFLCKLTSIKM